MSGVGQSAEKDATMCPRCGGWKGVAHKACPVCIVAADDAPSCHEECVLGPTLDHPGYLGYRCVDTGGGVLPWPNAVGKYDGWEPWEDATWD